MYSYREAVKSDVREWMEENYIQWQDLTEGVADEYVYDACWVSDSVTGNASGSYTFSRSEARDNFSEILNLKNIWMTWFLEGSPVVLKLEIASAILTGKNWMCLFVVGC